MNRAHSTKPRPSTGRIQKQKQKQRYVAGSLLQKAHRNPHPQIDRFMASFAHSQIDRFIASFVRNATVPKRGPISRSEKRPLAVGN